MGKEDGNYFVFLFFIKLYGCFFSFSVFYKLNLHSMEIGFF